MSIAGPWELLKRLSAGAMGEVFVARPASGASDRRVAVKLMLPHLAHDRAQMTRFLDEARLAARMSHPNVVQIFDVGMAEGRPWLAMELVEGVSLWTLLENARRRKEKLPLPLVRHIATGLCDALSYAHGLKGQAGEPLDIVHRDVSPSNVLVSGEGVVRLTDFGLARAVGNFSKTSGALAMKLGYAAPELAAGERVDQRADLFSAGATLFEALTLEQPFRRAGASDAQTLEALRRGEAPRPSTLRPGVRPQMEAALLRALRPDADDRFSSAAELRDALVDGDVATPSDLGAWVRRTCPVELARFFSLDTVPDEQLEVPTVTFKVPAGVVTNVARTTPITAAVPAPAPSRAFPLALGAFVLVAAGLFVAGLQLKEHGSAAAGLAARSNVAEPEGELELVLEEPGPEELDLPTLAVTAPVGYLTLDGDTSTPVTLDGQQLEPPWHHLQVPVGKHVLAWRGKKKTLTIHEGKTSRAVLK